MNTSIANISSSADLADVIGSLDLDNELLGSTEADDGVDLLAGKTTAPAEEDKVVDTTPAAAPVVAGTTAPSKADLARAIFNANYGVLARKDIIAKFISEAGLTKAGAGTYYQNFTAKMKKAAELTAGATTTDDSAE